MYVEVSKAWRVASLARLLLPRYVPRAGKEMLLHLAFWASPAASLKLPVYGGVWCAALVFSAFSFFDGMPIDRFTALYASMKPLRFFVPGS